MSARADLRTELDHCRRMVASTHDAIERRIRELSNVEIPIADETGMRKAYLLKHEPVDQEEVLFP